MQFQYFSFLTIYHYQQQLQVSQYQLQLNIIHFLFNSLLHAFKKYNITYSVQALGITRQCSSFFTFHLRPTLVKSAAAKVAHMSFYVDVNVELDVNWDASTLSNNHSFLTQNPNPIQTQSRSLKLFKVQMLFSAAPIPLLKTFRM